MVLTPAIAAAIIAMAADIAIKGDRAYRIASADWHTHVAWSGGVGW